MWAGPSQSAWCDPMPDDQTPPAAPAAPPRVLEPGRRDFTALVPEGRPRAQGMRGFDPDYSDIVDYIVRCTHRIWDERDVGLIYSHYTHNCVVYTSMGTVYDREWLVRDTIQRLVSFPERRGMATNVIWRGDEDEGFYTSHLVTGTGRHTQDGHLGPATGRPFVSRTVADCLIHENRIYKEWIVADTLAILLQCGIDADAYADRLARQRLAAGQLSIDIGESRRMVGQYPPEAEADLAIAHNAAEEWVLRWMHDVFNRRMFGTLGRVFAPNCQFHGPLMSELYGAAAVMHQTLGLLGSVPDGAWTPQHVCSVESEEGGHKVAVRWILEGHHLGHGILKHLGEPSGQRLQVMGISHLHVRDGRVLEEWRLYDELALMVQVRLGRMQAEA
jgi:predicted ester cyclase